MIPLFAFLILWLILVGVYVVLALITMMQMLRFGISSPSAIFLTIFYLIIAIFILGGTALYLFTVDWSIAFDLGPSLIPSFLAS
jgi:hypothetical protein